ncbi:MAG: polysaccharide deacetylase family protein [Bacteroidia bacterium]
MLIAINYHYIRDSFEAPFPAIFGQTPEEFENQLRTLGQQGEFVGQEDILNHLVHGKSLPEKSVLITFDDGLKEQYTRALPILERLGIPVVFYANARPLVEPRVLNVHKIHLLRSQVAPEELTQKIVEAIEKQQIAVDTQKLESQATLTYRYDSEDNARIKYLLNFVLDFREREILMDDLFRQYFGEAEAAIHQNLYMDAAEIREVAEKGYLGCHSYEHLPVGLLGKNALQKDISLSKTILEQAAGKPVYSFSYPYGSAEACQNVKNTLRQNHFQFAFTMERAINHQIGDPFYLSRFDTNDVPLGKSYPFQPEEMFEKLKTKSWNLN